jgi:hypothetical protein
MYIVECHHNNRPQYTLCLSCCVVYCGFGSWENDVVGFKLVRMFTTQLECTIRLLRLSSDGIAVNVASRASVLEPVCGGY